MLNTGWNRFIFDHNCLKPYVRNLKITYNPVEVDADTYNLLVATRKEMLATDVPIENRKAFGLILKSFNPLLGILTKKKYELYVKCFEQGFDTRVKVASPYKKEVVCAEVTTDPKKFLIAKMENGYVRLDDIPALLMDNAFCKKSTPHAKRMMNKLLMEISYKNYPMVVLMEQKVIIKYNYGSKLSFDDKITEGGETRQLTHREITIGLLKQGFKTKEEMAVELFRKIGKGELSKVARLLVKIRKMGILMSDKIDGRMVYSVKV